ncbi:MAG: transposase [Armatimonadetes bacterium]|nr:transposase [Armatimonadota bacterium]
MSSKITARFVGVQFIEPAEPAESRFEIYPKRKNIRLRYYDYKSDGYYFITICCFNFKPNLSKYQEVLKKILEYLPERFLGLKIDYFVLMPTHLHVIFVFEGCGVSLGEVVRTYKALVANKTRVKNFWQRNYYEHVIRNEKALLKIREYIKNNPDILKIKFEEFYKDNETGLINQPPTK